jgi:hypothetical protein
MNLAVAVSKLFAGCSLVYLTDSMKVGSAAAWAECGLFEGCERVRKNSLVKCAIFCHILMTNFQKNWEISWWGPVGKEQS